MSSALDIFVSFMLMKTFKMENFKVHVEENIILPLIDTDYMKIWARMIIKCQHTLAQLNGGTAVCVSEDGTYMDLHFGNQICTHGYTELWTTLFYISSTLS